MRMAEPRQSPYIWITWLTKLLVGENSGEWASWFKGQNEGWSWDKVPSTFDLAKWTVNHTALLGRVRAELEAEGYAVFEENQNQFTLRSMASGVAIAGKPDLIARRGTEGLIADAKTGKPRASDTIQVMMYMWAVPQALRQYAGVAFDGKVVYDDHEETIPSSAVDATFIRNIGNLIQRVSNPTPARKVPSALECGFCPITSTDCPERAASNTAIEGETSDF